LAVSSEPPLLIGVDGGATEVKAHAVVAAADGLVTATERATFRHALVDGFTPLPIEQQLADRESHRIDPHEIEQSASEREQADRWIDTFALAIESVAASARRADVLVGLCMPGLKTRDGRGIDAMRNGPRIPAMLDRLEERLLCDGIVLAAPIARILGDGEACGHGEEASPTGGFRSIPDAYYVGGGTGLAECFKIAGRVTALDDLAGTIPKAWSMKSSIRRSYEDHLSARGINARWVELGGDPHAMPESAWPRNLAAIQAFSEAVVLLDELVRARIDALQRAGLPTPKRLVVGQRLGALLALPQLATLRASAEGACPIELYLSSLRAAPAIGAAHIALREAGIARISRTSPSDATGARSTSSSRALESDVTTPGGAAHAD
jgi:hypothetical protein